MLAISANIQRTIEWFMGSVLLSSIGYVRISDQAAKPAEESDSGALGGLA
jgi:hypothetical protein